MIAQYIGDPESGQFRQWRDHPSTRRKWLSSVTLRDGRLSYQRSPPPATPSYQVSNNVITCRYMYYQECMYSW